MRKLRLWTVVVTCATAVLLLESLYYNRSWDFTKKYLNYGDKGRSVEGIGNTRPTTSSITFTDFRKITIEQEIINRLTTTLQAVDQHVTRNATGEKGTADRCKPSTRIVFLKTHKTGSSTMTSIFQRFGFSRNLSFATPKRGHVFSITGLFKRSYAKPGKFDMLVNHVRYNRKEMDAVMKADTKYVTILRDPATQAESLFGYFRLYRYLNLSKDANPFEKFISRPQYYMNAYKDFKMREHLKNPSIYDLGLEPTKQLDLVKVQSYIETLAGEFDLVLLQEYFNESLILLKKLFCWDMNDILYIIKGVRVNSLRFKLSDSLKNKTRKWNSVDAKLYDIFNATFWKKVSEYGSDFKKDLKMFEGKLNETFYECTLSDKKLKVSHRSYKFTRNPASGTLCEIMLLADIQFTEIIRNSNLTV